MFRDRCEICRQTTRLVEMQFSVESEGHIKDGRWRVCPDCGKAVGYVLRFIGEMLACEVKYFSLSEKGEPRYEIRSL